MDREAIESRKHPSPAVLTELAIFTDAPALVMSRLYEPLTSSERGGEYKSTSGIGFRVERHCPPGAYSKRGHT